MWRPLSKHPLALRLGASLFLVCPALALMCVAGCVDDKKVDPRSAVKRVDAAIEEAAPDLGRKEQSPRVFHRSLSEPDTLDPGLIINANGAVVAFDTFEGLYTHAADHKAWVPGVARRHEVSEDGLVWTFHLRRDSRWSDGAPVTAADFEYAWKRVLDPGTASRSASWLSSFIKGGKAYNRSTSADDQAALREAVGVEALDERTLRVTLENPLPFFHAVTTYQAFSPVPRHVVEKHGDEWARPEHIVSNGPWKTVEWKSKQRIKLEQNPHYWDRDAVPFDTVVYHITQEAGPAHNMYLAGELDLLEGKVPPSSYPKYILEQHPDLRVSPYIAVYQFLFNTELEPLDDKRVRKALNMALNKAQIGKHVVKGNQDPATSFVHPALQHMGYEPVVGAGYAPDEARALLAEAGFPDGRGFPTLRLSYTTMESNRLIAQFAQEQWRKNLGVEVELESMEWEVLHDRQGQHDYQISQSGWAGNTVDPLAFLVRWEGDSSFNNTRWRNAEFDAHVAQARRASTLQARNLALRKAEAVWVEEMPAMPVYFYKSYDMVQPWVKGYRAHIGRTHLSRYFSIHR